MDAQPGPKNANPFVYSRLRGYASAVDNVIDAKSNVANTVAVALTQPLNSGSSGQLPPLGGGQYQGLSGGWVAGMGSTGGSTAASGAPEVPQQVLDEIGALRAEIAGVESVIGFMKASSEGGISALGRKSSPLPTQQQLRARAEQYIRTLQDAPLMQANASARRSGSPAATTTESFRMTRWMDDTGVRSNSAPTPASLDGQQGFDRLTKDLKSTRGWRPAATPQPVGRGEAVVLEAALDEALPHGSIAAKYQANMFVDDAQSPAQAFVASQDIAHDFDALESVQREGARQVAAHCVERGRLLLKVAERYREFFSVLNNAVSALRIAKAEVALRLDEMAAHCNNQDGVIEALKQQVAAERQQAAKERELRVQVETRLEHVQHDAEQEASKLRAENQILASEVEHYMELLDQARQQGEESLEEGTRSLQAQVSALEDDKDALSQRTRFLERQINKLRGEMQIVPLLDNASVQTDPVSFVPDPADLASGSQLGADDSMAGLLMPPSEGEQLQRSKRRHGGQRTFGGFAGLVAAGSTQGRVRGAHWTVTCIAQIYVDKIVADAVSDREGNPRCGICEFAYDWHLTRYGLRNLAESNLLDLLASTRHHARRLQRVRWFGIFTGLVESPEHFDTPQHLGFYLFVLQQLAFPSSITGLFASNDNDDAPVLIKQQQAQEAVKAVYRYLNDADAASSFLSKHVENQGVDPELGVSGVVRCDRLVHLLMNQYRNRVERNVAHLKALFRAGDVDRDGLISYDEFVMLFRHANPDTSDRLMTKIYGEAVRALPPGHYLIPQGVFVDVAHTFGLDRWRIDASSLSSLGLPAPDGLAAALSRTLSARLKREGTLPAPGSVGGEGGLMGEFSSGLPSVPVMASRRNRNRQVDTLAQSEAMLLRMLDSTLSSLDPPLPDMMAAARERVAVNPSLAMSDPDLLPRLTALYNHMAEARAGTPGAFGAVAAAAAAGGAEAGAAAAHAPDAAAAWLAFRMLYAALTAVLTRKPSSRTSSRIAHSPSRRGGGASLVSGSGAWRAGPVASAPPPVSGLVGGDGLSASAPPARALNLRSGGGNGPPSPSGLPRTPSSRPASRNGAGLQATLTGGRASPLGSQGGNRDVLGSGGGAAAGGGEFGNLSPRPGSSGYEGFGSPFGHGLPPATAVVGTSSFWGASPPAAAATALDLDAEAAAGARGGGLDDAGSMSFGDPTPRHMDDMQEEWEGPRGGP